MGTSRLQSDILPADAICRARRRPVGDLCHGLHRRVDRRDGAYSARPMAPAPPARSRPGPALVLAMIPMLSLGGLLVPQAATGRPVTVAVIQGNVPRLGLDFLGNARQSSTITSSRPDASHPDRPRPGAPPGPGGRERQRHRPLPRRRGAPVDRPGGTGGRSARTGGAVIVRSDGEHLENRGIVWDPRTGAGDYYVKRHPVPFGEYIPSRDRLRQVITRFQRWDSSLATARACRSVR